MRIALGRGSNGMRGLNLQNEIPKQLITAHSFSLEVVVRKSIDDRNFSAASNANTLVEMRFERILHTSSPTSISSLNTIEEEDRNNWL